MKILVYGAGNIGCLYAALLQNSGSNVSILARGARLHEIRREGIRIENALSGERTTVPVDVVERLDPDDAYDLILVVLPKTHIAEVLPILAANQRTPSIMFFGNNAAGPRELTGALDRSRVLLGFPGAAAILRDGCLHYLITSVREQPTTIGELDGSKSLRVQAITEALRKAGFSTATSAAMDAWLKTHVAEIIPTVTALYMAGGDTERLARTRDALVVMLRAIREGYRVLKARGIPVTPANRLLFKVIPEPLLLLIMQRMTRDESGRIKVAHAFGARDEWLLLADEFRVLIDGSSVATPAIDRLTTYLDPTAEPIPDGASELSLRWAGTGILLAIIATFATLVGLIVSAVL